MAMALVFTLSPYKPTLYYSIIFILAIVTILLKTEKRFHLALRPFVSCHCQIQELLLSVQIETK